MSQSNNFFKNHGQTLRRALLGGLVSLGVIDFGVPAYGLDSITVTARKREEALQDVPVAVSAFTSEHLNDINVSRLEELSAMAPNIRMLSASTGPSVATIYIRGIGYGGTEKLDAPPVGVFIDGFYYGIGQGQLIDTFDIESVQVLRGPQSVLYGKNTSGGALIVQRTRPKGEASLKVKAGLGNYNQEVLQVTAHLPEWNNISLKLGATHKERDGFYENLFTGRSIGEDRHQALHGMLSWEPRDNLKILFIGDLVEERGESPPLQVNNPLAVEVFGPILPPSFTAGGALNPGVGAHHVWNGLGTDFDYDARRYSMQVDWETSIGKVTSVTAYLDEQDNTLSDFDGGCAELAGCTFTPNPLLQSAVNPFGVLHTIRDQEFDEFTQEMRIANQITDQIFAQGGFYYYKDEILSQQTTNFAGFEKTTQDTESFSLFGQVGWEFIPGVTANVGAQWITEEKSFSKIVGTLPLFVGPIALPLLKDKKSWEDIVYSASLEWQINEDHLAYFSLSDGFRSGGFSARGTAAEQVDVTAPNYTGGAFNFLSFDPEETRQFEIGLKNTLWDGNMTLNLTAFMTKLEGFQASTVVLTPSFPVNTNSIINNLGKVAYKGFEVELVAAPPQIPGLTLSANFGYLDSQIKDGTVPATRIGAANGQAGFPGSPDVDLSNQTLVQSPEYTYSLLADYERELNNGMNVGGTVSWAYTDDVSLVNQKDPLSAAIVSDIQPGYGLLSAAVRANWRNFQFQVSGKNMLEKDYRQTALAQVWFQSFGNPATYMFEMTMKFGAE